MNSVSGYTPRIPSLIGAWVKTERKRNAAHGDSHFQTESELRAEGERAIDAHDAEVRQAVLEEVIKKLAFEWLMFLPEEDTAFAQGARLAIDRIQEAFDETDI